MADWRARGYVVDSDEEEDSQTFISKPLTTLQEAPPNIDDIGSGEAEGQRNGSIPAHRAVVELQRPETDIRTGSGGAEAEEEHAVDDSLIPLGQDGQEDDMAMDLTNVGIEGWIPIEECRDIDELQQDHYDATPSAQLEGEFERRTWKESRGQDRTPPFRRQSSDHSSTLHLLSSAVYSQSGALSPLADTSSSTMGQAKPGTARIRSGCVDAPLPLPVVFPPSGNIPSSRPARSLRHRNAIQLHPYLVESEKYRQSLKARGLRPLRMDQEISRALEAESQNAAYNGTESQLDGGEGDVYSSSLVESQDSSTKTANEQGEIFVLGEDELPDMNAVLRNPLRTYVDNGYKRRKTAPATVSMPSRMLPDQRGPMVVVPVLQDDDRIFDVPPSPPHSRSSTPQKIHRPKKPKFRMPKGPSPAALPTPVTSSEPRRRAFLHVSDDESSDGQEGKGTQSVHVSDVSDTGDCLSEDEPLHQLQRVQRRIRGVLPASWLKLDLKSQKKRPDASRNVQTSLSPERVSTQRGIARPVASSRSKRLNLSGSRDGPIPLSDLEDSDSDSAIRGSSQQHCGEPSYTETRDSDNLFMTGRLGEALEDDQVDDMLPTVSRKHAHHRKEKKPRRSADFVSNSNSVTSLIAKKTRSSRQVQPRITKQFEKAHRRKPVFRPPKLSILDAPSLRESSRTLVPRFLSIASRSTRSRNDKGRHSPSKKYMRLATRDDDNDTNETLRDWREGTIAPLQLERAMPANSRRPLHPRSSNNTLPSGIEILPDGTKKREMIAVNSNRTRAQHRSAKSRSLQTTLNNLVHSHRSMTDIAETPDAKRASAVDNGLEKGGQIVTSLIANSDARPAMLESTRNGDYWSHTQTSFQRDLARINHFGDMSGLPNVLRLFENEQRPATKTAHPLQINGKGQERSRKPIAANKNSAPRRSRKRQPQRMEVPAPWSRASGSPIVLDDFTDDVPFDEPLSAQTKDVLLGLGPFGTRYSINFDINPLPTGTCFDNSTVLGSGIFAKSLKLFDSNGLDSSRGFQAWTHEGRMLRWGPWNDTVSSELGEVIDLANQAAHDLSMQCEQVSRNTAYEKPTSLLRMVVGYFSDNLSFSDPIDRVSCVQRSKVLISTLLIQFIDKDCGRDAAELQANATPQPILRVPNSTLILVFANQLRQLANHDIVPQQLQDEVKALVHTIAQKTLKLVLGSRFQEFEDCLSRFKDPDPANYILDQHHAIEAFIVSQYVYSQQCYYKLDVLQDLHDIIAKKSANGDIDIRSVEQCWKKLFTLLPFLEFDSTGTLETGRRFKVALDNWTLVKRMISPVLEASLNNPGGQSSSFNSYCRTIFARCLHLINGWGWRKCDSIIGILFDFFARNHLRHLRNEKSHGSPIFLERLDKKPSFNAEPEDRCFHILLKIIGSGLKFMRRLYPEKKMRDVVWRLMPNHGRLHPKEEAIRQEDLDALRNHHDLLCTLYWASPPSCRPRLTVIRNLVHLETSHREACHINIRAWYNLVKFQLSTDEPVFSLEPFAEWYDDLLQQILRQHALARTEAEEQVRSVQYSGGLAISEELLESTIAKNQRQVEAILSDALVSIKLAIDATRNQEAAAVLMTPTLAKAFDLFDARRPQATMAVVQTLDVLLAYVNVVLAAQTSRDENDDSQDYGDWTAFEDDSPTTKQADQTRSLLQTFQEPLRHLLSNCFGADQAPEDSLLFRLVDAWVAVAQLLVRCKMRSWSDYVDRFGNDTWGSLRGTEQTRKYTTYFLTTLIEKDGSIYRDHQTFFLSSWIGSLVERDSLLKFQHNFTEALLNAVTHSPLLENLPFFSDSSTGRFRVTAFEFSERRLSLISSVLSNIRTSLEQAVFNPAVDAVQLRQECKDLLKHLMGTMKHNYQELGQGSNLKGAYVDFVHRVVEVLQQHTSTICPIDRFFTDNGAFPLPATDPTYVVGQLKNYALRLQDPKTPKQLAAFLQSVSERAAVDGQQPYLAGQLHIAMSNAFEDGVSTRPTLRSFIIKAVTPAYTGSAFTTESGWILALPYLQALQKVFSEVLSDLDGCNTNSVNAVASIITAFLDSVRRSLGILLHPSKLLEEPRVLKTLSAYYSAITALLPILDYLTRLDGPTERAVDDIDFLKSFTIYASMLLNGNDDPFAPEINDSEDATYAETRNFASQELRDTLTKNWAFRNGRHYMTRGGSRREVVVDVGLFEEEKEQLFKIFGEFVEFLGTMPALGDEDDHARALELGRRRETGLDDLFP